MAVNLINSNDIEVTQTGNNIQLSTTVDMQTLESNVDTNTTDITNIKDGNVYSISQEIDTGKKLGNKTIYRAYIEYSHASTGSYTYNHNLGIGEVVSINGYCTISGQTVSSHGYRQFPQIDTSTGYMFTINNITENSITTKATGWQNNHIYIWLEYTKTS